MVSHLLLILYCFVLPGSGKAHIPYSSLNQTTTANEQEVAAREQPRREDAPVMGKVVDLEGSIGEEPSSKRARGESDIIADTAKVTRNQYSQLTTSEYPSSRKTPTRGSRLR